MRRSSKIEIDQGENQLSFIFFHFLHASTLNKFSPFLCHIPFFPHTIYLVSLKELCCLVERMNEKDRQREIEERLEHFKFPSQPSKWVYCPMEQCNRACNKKYFHDKEDARTHLQSRHFPMPHLCEICQAVLSSSKGQSNTSWNLQKKEIFFQSRLLSSTSHFFPPCFLPSLTKLDFSISFFFFLSFFHSFELN